MIEKLRPRDCGVTYEPLGAIAAVTLADTSITQLPAIITQNNTKYALGSPKTLSLRRNSNFGYQFAIRSKNIASSAANTANALDTISSGNPCIPVSPIATCPSATAIAPMKNRMPALLGGRGGRAGELVGAPLPLATT
jgi:hypothetical protein